MTPPKQMVMAPIYGYLKDHADTVVSISEIERDLRLTGSSASAALSKMAHDSRYRVYSGPHRGSYIYRSGPRENAVEPEKVPVKETPKVQDIDIVNAYPPAKLQSNSDYGKGFNIPTDHIYIPTATVHTKPTPRMYEFVAQFQGAELIRDEQSNLFVAVPFADWVASRG